jgi:hypothetical protein
MSTPPIFGIVEAAERIKLCVTRVKQICRQHGIGQVVGGRRILTDSDLPLIEANRGKRGNPTLAGSGSNNGGGRKPPKTKRKTAISRKSKK